MSFLEKKKHKNQCCNHEHGHNDDCCNHKHNHEHNQHDHDCCEQEHHDHHHDNDGCCCGHEHDHGHGHGCDCCEDGVEIEKNKTIAGVVVFLIAFVLFEFNIFGKLGLFTSVSDKTMDTAELIIFAYIFIISKRYSYKCH